MGKIKNPNNVSETNHKDVTKESGKIWQTMGILRFMRRLKGPLQKYSFIYRIVRRLYPTPLKRILAELKLRGTNLKNLECLSLFGGSGMNTEVDIYKKVKSLDIWEFDHSHENNLKKNFPKAQIRICDTFNELKYCKRKYSLIISDNFASIEGGCCEHFDCFPYIFRVVKDDCILLLNVILEIPENHQWYNGINDYVFFPEHLARRKAFYKTNNPTKLSKGDAIKAYEFYINESGFELEYYFFEKRHDVHCLVMKIKKNN